MMNAMTCSSEVSGYYEQSNGTTFFNSFPCIVETALQKGINAIHTLADVGQWSKSDSHNDTTFNATAKEHSPTHRMKVLKTQMVE